MKIGQWLLEGAPIYEEKSQALDAEWLGRDHSITAWPDPTADVVHVYGPRKLAARCFRKFPRPYVAAGAPPARGIWFSTPRPPAGDASPPRIPEAVDPRYVRDKDRRPETARYEIGVLGGRRDVRPIVEVTASRLARFRDDVHWRMVDDRPSPEDLAAIDVWVDPAIVDDDRDGFGAEAISAGVLVVASRTPINLERLEGGRAGFLVPPNDPNELTHAILTALFKPEMAEPKRHAARNARARFDPARRRDALVGLYREVLG